MPQAVHTSRGPKRMITASGGAPSVPAGVMSRDNISFVGYFGIMQSNAPLMAFANGGATGRTLPGGQVSFLAFTGPYDIYQSLLAEFPDPGTYSLDWQTAPRSADPFLWADQPSWAGTHRASFFPDGSSRNMGPFAHGNIYWSEANQLLYWTYYDVYNTSNYLDWNLGATQLTNPVGPVVTPYGPWRTTMTDGAGTLWYGPNRGLFMSTNPLTGKMMMSSSIVSGNSASPWGPNMFSGLDFPTALTPAGFGNPDLHFPDCYLNHYFMGGQINADTGAFSPPLRSFRRRYWPYICEPVGSGTGSTQTEIDPQLNGGVGSWTAVDSASSPVWLNLTNTKGVLFFGAVSGSQSQDTSNCNNAHTWYMNTGLQPEGRCHHGCLPPPGTTTGPTSRSKFPFLAIYNPDDLAAVKNTPNDYTPEPVDFINLEETYGIHTAPLEAQAGKSVGPVYFDPVRNYLFCIAPQSDPSYVPGANCALMLVFHIADEA